MNFQPPSYFDAVIRGFIGKGYALVSQVSIDNREFPYHVTVEGASSTTIVFHKPGRQLIFVLEFIEHEGMKIGTCRPDPYTCYWSLRIHANHGEWKDVLPLLDIENRSILDEERYRKMPYFEEQITPEGFTRCSMSYEQQPAPKAVPHETLVTNITVFLKTFEPFLGKGVFPELLVSFAPGYTFKDCEESFWSQFDVRYLRTLIRRPYGAKPFERRWRHTVA